MAEIAPFLHEFGSSLEASESFLQTLSLQLTEDYQRKTGLLLEDDAMMMPPLPDPFTVRTEGPMSFVDADLLAGFEAVRVTFGWGPGSGNDPLIPGSDAGPEDMQAFWEYLPKDELMASFGDEQTLPFEVTAFNFAVNFSAQSLPECLLDIHLSRKNISLLEETLEKAVEEWNAKGETVIHKLGSPDEIASGRYQVAADLGSALFDGLEHVLNALEASDLEVMEVGLLEH